MKNRGGRVELGTVSEGTLREEDLVPAFLWELRMRTGRDGRRAYVKIRREFKDLIDADGDVRGEGDWSGKAGDNADNYEEEVGYLQESLFDALGELAPAYCYFGSLEGDGACFGFWVAEDSLAEGINAGEVWVDPDNGSRCPKTASYRLVVSDHGNRTLYHRNGREVWGIV